MELRSIGSTVLVVGRVQFFVDGLVSLLSTRSIAAIGAISAERARQFFDKVAPRVIVADCDVSDVVAFLRYVRASGVGSLIIGFRSSVAPMVLPPPEIFDKLLPQNTPLNDLVFHVEQAFPSDRPHPPRILLVDDEEAILDILTEFFATKHYVTMRASSGEEGLTILRTIPDFDAVLLDIKLTGIGGIETLKELKRVNPDLPVLMLTGVVDAEVARAATRLGAFDYILKPVDLQQLDATVSACLALTEYRRNARRGTKSRTARTG